MVKKWYGSWDPSVPKCFTPKKSFVEYFKEVADKFSDNIAISYYGCDLTYHELSLLVDKCANGLSELGLKKGDRVALFMQNCPQFAISFLGILQAGGVVVALNPMFKHAELEFELKDSGASMLIALDILYPEIQRIKGKMNLEKIIITSLSDYLPEILPVEVPNELANDKLHFQDTIDFLDLIDSATVSSSGVMLDLKKDIALLQYTGGTTGIPKAAVISHFGLAYAACVPSRWWHWKNDDVHLVVTPIFHTFGMIHCLCAPLLSGGRLVFLARFSVESTVKAISHYECTVWSTSATMIIALLNWQPLKAEDIKTLLLISLGGAPMPKSCIDRLNELSPQIIIREGLGFSETSSGSAIMSPLHCIKSGYIGIPNISTDVKIVDLNSGDNEVSPDTEGEIIVKGKSIMKGYWKNPAETRKALRKGWFYTGDIGKMNEEGWVAIVGRKKEMIKCSGFSVFPAEVEELLYRHPAIAQVAVIGVQDSYRGETPKAFVVLKNEYKNKICERDIIDWAKDNMATYKRPRLVEFREELPRSGAGKILRRVLADQENTE